MNDLIRKSFTRQQGQSDCGVACLSSIIQFHGGDAILERLRELSGTSKTGTTLIGLLQASQLLGFDADALEAESIENLKELNEPAILHVTLKSGLHHYVVYYKINNNGVVIGDPAIGISNYTYAQLDEIWKEKVVLKLVPNEKFIKSKRKKEAQKKWIYEFVKEDLNILMVALIIGIAISLLSLSTAVFSQKLIDTILPSKDMKRLIIGLVSVVLLLLGRSGLSYLRSLFLIHQSKEFNNRIIEKFYNKLLRLPKSFFDTRKTGELVSRMNDTRRIQSTVTLLTGNVIIDVLFIITSVSLVFAYSWIVGLVVVFIVPVYFLIAYKLNEPIAKGQQEAMASYAQTESNYIDSISGVSAIKGMNKESFFGALNKQLYNQFQTKLYDLGKINIQFALWTEILGAISIGAVFAMCSFLVLNENLKAGELVAIFGMSANVIPSVARIVIANFQVQEAKVAFDRMHEFTSLDPEYDSEEASDKLELNSLELKDVSFRFPGRKSLFQNVNLRVKKGETVAILGESGNGKSTLLQILQRFYSAESGEIKIDNRDWLQISTPVWRSIVAAVPQDVKLFNGTLIYNITLSDSLEHAKEAIALCEKSGLHSYFETFPQGYLTLLGEEGINISGGQRQLVGLARALFTKPQLLLLDEATSAMDKKTEAFVMDLLRSVKREFAIVFVTHRASVAREADRIYVVQRGELREAGKPELAELESMA